MEKCMEEIVTHEVQCKSLPRGYLYISALTRINMGITCDGEIFIQILRRAAKTGPRNSLRETACS